jgi:cell division protein FtsL
MASFAPTARAESTARAPVSVPPLRAPRPRRPSRAAEQRRVAGSVLWIGLFGLLLAGVVAVNVASLRLNLRLDDMNRERAKLRAENAALASKLSSASSTIRIQNVAQAQLGVVPVPEEQTQYVTIPRR